MISELATEKRNPKSQHIDTISTKALVETINNEDALVPKAIAKITTPLALAIDEAASRYRRGGRLIYCGAGTSGRLGVLDAAELVPTYGIQPERAVGLIAGGPQAMLTAVEGAEDSPVLGRDDLINLNLSADDVVIGIAASGRTPYVLGALDYANETGALTIAVACVSPSEIGQKSQIALEAVVGPEVVTGSTRMKAGSAQKMILNTLSTGVMIRVGKVYENLMVDVLPTNEKLIDRSERIIADVASVDRTTAHKALIQANKHVPLAIVIAKTGLRPEEAQALLDDHDGIIASVFEAWEAK